MRIVNLHLVYKSHIQKSTYTDIGAAAVVAAATDGGAGAFDYIINFNEMICRMWPKIIGFTPKRQNQWLGGWEIF